MTDAATTGPQAMNDEQIAARGLLIRANLKRLIAKDGRSPRAISIQAGLGESFIKHLYESPGQRPGFHNLAAIAGVLGVPLAEITGDDALFAPPVTLHPGEFIQDQTELSLIHYLRALTPERKTSLIRQLRAGKLGR